MRNVTQRSLRKLCAIACSRARSWNTKQSRGTSSVPRRPWYDVGHALGPRGTHPSLRVGMGTGEFPEPEVSS